MNDRCMDCGNGSCKGKNLRINLNEDDQGIGSSQDGCKSKEQITTSKLVEVSAGSSSGDVDSEPEDHAVESSGYIALGTDEDGPVSARGIGESSVGGRDAENISPISGRIDRERDSVERASKRQSLERTNLGSYTNTERTQASKRQWPKWTVSHMTSLSTMEKVMSYYRALDLADNLSDKDLRCFLEEQLSKEKAGLSETTIMNRLRTKLYESEKVCEPDSCSICMVEYKDQDEIASLYYCSHEYHSACIKEWLLKNNLCPMCRALAVIPEDYPCWDGDVRLHQAFFVHLKFAT